MIVFTLSQTSGHLVMSCGECFPHICPLSSLVMTFCIWIGHRGCVHYKIMLNISTFPCMDRLSFYYFHLLTLVSSVIVALQVCVLILGYAVCIFQTTVGTDAKCLMFGVGWHKSLKGSATPGTVTFHACLGVRNIFSPLILSLMLYLEGYYISSRSTLADKELKRFVNGTQLIVAHSSFGDCRLLGSFSITWHCPSKNWLYSIHNIMQDMLFLCFRTRYMPSNSVTLVAVCLHRGFGQTERAEKLAILFRSLSTVCSALVSLPLLVLCSVHAVI